MRSLLSVQIYSNQDEPKFYVPIEMEFNGNKFVWYVSKWGGRYLATNGLEQEHICVLDADTPLFAVVQKVREYQLNQKGV